jgi:hypothetical protein
MMRGTRSCKSLRSGAERSLTLPANRSLRSLPNARFARCRTLALLAAERSLCSLPNARFD